MVAYWPWHSIHNSAETYWKGLLSHDLEPNPTYNEAQQIATELQTIGSHIINLKKNNKVAIYFSNESLSALEKFPIHDELDYNDVVRKFYEVLYRMNIECDFIDHTSDHFDQYDLILVPPLYVASDAELIRFNEFVVNGGQLLLSFKTGFSNEHVQVRTDRQPGIIRKMCGVSYQQFTTLSQLPLMENNFDVEADDNYVSYWAELLVPEGAEVLGRYDHPYWNKYAAIVRNTYGKGRVTYLGTWPSDAILRELLKEHLGSAGINIPDSQFPVIIRNGINSNDKTLHYIFNYSQEELLVNYSFRDGTDLLSQEKIDTGDIVTIKPWDLLIVKEF